MVQSTGLDFFSWICSSTRSEFFQGTSTLIIEKETDIQLRFGIYTYLFGVDSGMTCLS